MFRPRPPTRRLLFALPWGAALVLWFLDALAAPRETIPSPVDATVAWVVVVSLAVGSGYSMRRLWRGDGSDRLLLAVVLVAVVTFFTGLGQEVIGRYYGDEGIYLAQARRINEEGQLLRPWFIYPHLLFYLDAFALWLASSLGPVAQGVARALYGIEHPAAFQPLVTRGVTALMGAGSVIPAFVAARRVAGPVAAGISGFLVALCPIYIRIAHLNISDVAGAFFAAMTFMQCAVLLDRESGRDYVLAGLCAGLAAGGKYPAGLVAIAIVGVWIGWRIRKRRLGLGLLWAGLVAVGAFLATTPSLLVFPEAVYGGKGTADVFFGFRQYALRGWTGVVRASNGVFYLNRLQESFGMPALLLGLSGIPWLDRRTRWRLLWLTPFPIGYLLLMLSMRIALGRNLMPVLPPLAVLLGCGAWGWVALATRRRWITRSQAAAVVSLACLALPLWSGKVSVVRFSRPTTRELAAAWIPSNLPPGSSLVQEVYTPQIRPEHLYPAVRRRFVIRFPPAELRNPRFDFVFLASGAYGRFFAPRVLDDPDLTRARERYEELFETLELVARWVPDRFRAGPTLRLYELDPVEPPWTDLVEREARSLLVSNPAMRKGEPGGAVRFRSLGQWALVKGYLGARSYRVELELDRGAEKGLVRVLNRRGEEIDLASLVDGVEARIELPGPDKYFVYLRLPPGSVLRGVRIERSEARPGDGRAGSRYGDGQGDPRADRPPRGGRPLGEGPGRTGGSVPSRWPESTDRHRFGAFRDPFRARSPISLGAGIFRWVSGP
ncbi:MAG: glycosyltransferase family 39 protein [Thermoanaerobaculia bacterium]|nr:glycosyltransferase family 39 protein [Thermoanaerobaculia bacterium]